MPKPRQPLKVFPVLVWDNPKPAADEQLAQLGRHRTPEAAAEEVARIEGELAKIAKAADFPVEIAKVASVNNAADVKDSAELKAADVVIMYGAGIAIDACKDLGKDVILFQRHRSGPVYLQYEVISPRFLRKHTDKAAIPHIAFDDVVTDSLDEIVWRLRSLCGLEEHQVHEDHVPWRARRLGPAGGSRARRWSRRSGTWIYRRSRTKISTSGLPKHGRTGRVFR